MALFLQRCSMHAAIFAVGLGPDAAGAEDTSAAEKACESINLSELFLVAWAAAARFCLVLPMI
jgi:hypothetical protein